MHKEATGKCEIKEASEALCIALVHISDVDADVRQSKTSSGGTSPIDHTRVLVNPDDPPVRSDGLRQYGEGPERAAPAVDSAPTVLDADGAEGGPSGFCPEFRDLHQPGQISVVPSEPVATICVVKRAGSCHHGEIV